MYAYHIGFIAGGVTAAAMKADSIFKFQKLGRKKFPDDRQKHSFLPAVPHP